MAKVKVDSLEPGMVVGADVKNLEGMLLMPAGCELSERHIRVLKTWGIPEVVIQNAEGVPSPAAGPGTAPASASAGQMRALRARFWQFDEANVVHRELLRCLVNRKPKASAAP